VYRSGDNKMTPMKIVLAGQPNVGKSSLINAMSNSRLKVGNFSGVTVEKTQICFEHHCHQIEMIDLPGTYSIDGFTKEEKVARDFLVNEEYDIIINVIDATHLTRNLLLTLELLNLNKKMVIALNMYDEAKKDGIHIDIKQLEAITGVPTIAVCANSKEGVEELLEITHNYYDNPQRIPSSISFSDIFEEELYYLSKLLDAKGLQYKDLTSREMALKLILEDEKFYQFIHDKPIFAQIQPALLITNDKISTYFETEDISEIKTEEYHSIAGGIRLETVTRDDKRPPKKLTKRIDNILIDKYIGIPIFLFLMWGLFQLTFELGSIPMDYIDLAFTSFGNALGENIAHDGLRSLVVDGIISGVGAVMMFLPNIIILYIGIAMLETTGYMSRVAFLLDGFFHKFGLHGKSFIPLVTGFGCSVPAYMATRTLKNEKDRLITLFIIGFMSCGAKLPVYVLFVGAFFTPQEAGNVLFMIYIAGAILGLVMAKILRLTAFKGDDEPFVMEMPKYRWPTMKLIYTIVSQKAYSYIKKAGTFILAAAVLIWFASNYPKTDTTNQAIQLENSYLGQIGKATEPFFAPLGFDWKLAVALETGLAAKEVVVATLGILYHVGDGVGEDDDRLLKELKAQIPFETAMSFITFVMIYLPCLAATAVFTKEAGSYKYTIYLFLFTTVTAWIMSFLVYNILK
jgi:ferrous iron transport protein B